MLDRWTLDWIRPLTSGLAKRLDRWGVTPDQVTIVGFLIGMGAIPAIWQQQFYLAAGLVVLNRLFDGLDGALARITGPSDAGGFLDIVLDFLFYSGVVWGFALANPERNGLPAATLIFSFIGTGSSFLAFAILAAKRQIDSITYPQKSFYYLGGLTEGTETIAALLAFCLFPSCFPLLAYIFAGMCWLTIITRIIGGYYTLKNRDR